MSKTNIRLFVPNTTEALDFEYGLLIHYMSYNEYRAQSEIGLQYYELAEIDPIDNALDIVQQKVITDAARSQSKIDGFTLDSHYTLSFGERLNNKIAEDSVRQVWLWLHCKNKTEYPFLLEKMTDTDQKIVSEQNQLLVRNWVHPEWQEREIDPLAQAKINNRLELISVMKQALSAQFDQIEQANRQKVLADLKLKTLSTPLPTIHTAPILTNLVSAAPQAEYKPKPIIQKSIDNIQSSIKYAVLLAEMKKKTYTIDQAELRINAIKAEVKKIKQDMNTIDDDFIETSSACVKYVQDCIRKIISEREVFYANRVDKHVFIFLVNKSLVLLEQLMRLDMHDEARKDLAQSITEIKKMQNPTGSETAVRNSSTILTSGDLNIAKQPVDKNQEDAEEKLLLAIGKIIKIVCCFAVFLLIIGVSLSMAGNKSGEVMVGLGAMLLFGAPVAAVVLGVLAGIYFSIVEEIKK